MTFPDAIHNVFGVAIARRRIRLEIEACAAVCAYVGDVPDNLTPDLFTFPDTHLIFTTAVYDGIPELPQRLRNGGFWRVEPDPVRDLDAMSTASDWSYEMLIRMCQWPRGNTGLVTKLLIEHHRITRDARTYLNECNALLEAVADGVEIPNGLGPLDIGFQLVKLARLSATPVEDLADRIDHLNTTKPRRVA
jgi:hypothetical protein